MKKKNMEALIRYLVDWCYTLEGQAGLQRRELNQLIDTVNKHEKQIKKSKKSKIYKKPDVIEKGYSLSEVKELILADDDDESTG